MEKNNAMNENNVNKHLFATFILRGKGLNPQEVTDNLGINPTKSFKRGEWRTSTEKWTRNYWSLTSQEKVQSDDLSNHIEWVIEQFEPVLPKLNEILSNKDVQGEISCFWILPAGHDGLSLNPVLLRKIADLKLILKLDIYCLDEEAI